MIDKATYEDQLAHISEEIALAELEIHNAKLDELDIGAALNFVTIALRTLLSSGCDVH